MFLKRNMNSSDLYYLCTYRSKDFVNYVLAEIISKQDLVEYINNLPRNHNREHRILVILGTLINSNLIYEVAYILNRMNTVLTKNIIDELLASGILTLEKYESLYSQLYEHVKVRIVDPLELSFQQIKLT